jgi:tetratricopeptide (TPR) repeat protein
LKLFDNREFWDFNDPVTSRERFEMRLAAEESPEVRDEIRAQIARTYGLEKRFDEGFAYLDAHANPDGDSLWFKIERGRLHRSSGQPDQAKPFFAEIAEHADDSLKVDALHMLAILTSGDEAIALNNQALEIAKISAHPFAQRWQGSLLNNLGWAYFDKAEYETAITCFRQALTERQKTGNPGELHVAEWAIARMLRAQSQHLDAIEILKRLDGNTNSAYPNDPYVIEELAENFEALGDQDQGKKMRQRIKKD